MTLHLYGGFGDKGGLCLGLRSGNFGVLVDAGVHTGAGAARYPEIEVSELKLYHALILTHGHEDHVAALGWVREQGFTGPVVLTEETRADALDIGRSYAESRHRPWIEEAPFRVIEAGTPFDLGPFHVTTGRSGHAVGGIWCLFTAEAQRVLYCGDVVPNSRVLAMDPLPECDLMLIDASYADEGSSMDQQQRHIAQWLGAHPGGAVLPTPLTGRSLELLALVGRVAIARSMRESLARQLGATRWLAPDAQRLSDLLTQAEDWDEDQTLPGRPLLCDDGMGQRGPSAAALEAAVAAHHPILLTGHLPRGSLGQTLHQAGRAEWIRYPTHPTLAETLGLVADSGPWLVIGHSCPPEGLGRLAAHLPQLDARARNGAVYDLDPSRPATPGCNLRALAGGRWYRSDALTGLSAAARSRVDALGLTTVVDLRSEAERKAFPCDLAGAAGVEYRAIDLDRGMAGHLALGTDIRTLADLYVALLEHRTAELGAALRTLARAPGPAVFHCAAGKDRTGIVAMLVLGLRGADEPTIVTDYLATRAALAPLLPFLAASPSIRKAGRAGLGFLETDPAALQAALDWIKARGGFTTYATLRLGLTDEELEAFRSGGAGGSPPHGATPRNPSR